METNKLSVVIITKNEENFITDAIKSALFADEVIILDSGSIDKTCEIAKELGAKVYQNEWLGFGPQKNRAVELAKNDWVFVLDSDERITKELKDEIVATLKEPQFNGYFIARLNNFFGKNIKNCGLYPDYSIRLFNKNYGKFNDVSVHESVQLTSKAAYLKNHMIHLAYDSIEEFIQKQNRNVGPCSSKNIRGHTYHPAQHFAFHHLLAYFAFNAALCRDKSGRYYNSRFSFGG